MSGTADFMQFVNYMQCTLSDANTPILTNLYVNFTTYQPPIGCINFAEKFIFWKQLYDQFAQEQEKIANANLFAQTPQPTDPRLKITKTQLPEDLTSLCNNNDRELFQTFDLTNDHTTALQSQPACDSHVDNNAEISSTETTMNADDTIATTETAPEPVAEAIVEILNTSHPEQTPPTSDEEEKPPTPNYVRSPSRGKNIEQLKAIHNEIETATKTKQRCKPTPVPRKRKRAPTNVDGPGPGTPSKDSALLRDAKNAEIDDVDTMAIREVALFSSNGQVRKKARLLTKHNKDVKCFAIKHYSPLEYIAEKKLKAFQIIKEQRLKLKTLNYMEQNVLANLEEIQNF
ncbi:Hypothetical predicted protein [Paramuricea clavata]|uniref:Uncharacterized protein n=1 Tax=Paramuricea clavata TaxID=317549 RepID=A0A6S7FZZ1_PARCT|nr:Hypothetical predicted protein [Paramuricea clavata]